MLPHLSTYFKRTRHLSRRVEVDEDDHETLHTELFTLRQLETLAKRLAKTHLIEQRRGPNFLLTRLQQNEEILRKYNEETTSVEKYRPITPAAEWLLDNFYLIQEQIHISRIHLPLKYSQKLPRLTKGGLQGYPRVYSLAMELISHVDGRIDSEHLTAFIRAYQEIQPLKLSELWAIPIMLRMGLLENLSRIAARLSRDRYCRDLADTWADKILEVSNNKPSDLIIVLGQMIQAHPELSTAFVTEFSRRLHGQTSSLQFVINWINQQLVSDNISIEQMVLCESKSQATDQVSVGNSITSLRFIGSMDWPEFVETLSLVEHTLRLDPSDIYSEMDFETRDMYRHEIERIASTSKISEVEVAKKVIDLASRYQNPKESECIQRHIGYYLIGEGVCKLEQECQTKPSILNCFGRKASNYSFLFYLLSISLLSFLVAGLFMQITGIHELTILSVLTFCLVLVSSSQLSLSLIHWIATLLISPKLLPRLEFSLGIPKDHSALVAVPTMLCNRPAIEKTLEIIELHYLANQEENLFFGLITDWKDSNEPVLDEDDQLLLIAKSGIQRLNEKYGNGIDLFFLFHRSREWNASERQWMGYERKRGKIAELIRFLATGSAPGFSTIVGNSEYLFGVKYLITLDSDTRLPRDTARKMIGTMAHPLNRAVVDNHQVIKGYGILQPRIGVYLPSSRTSPFAKLFSTESGVDPYTKAVSDVYQDLFQEGSFIGKGILDVQACFQVLKARFPENTLLSHDLLESCYVRSGLVSDVQLFEDFPSHYMSDVNRRHRWIRGDWQIFYWLLPFVPSENWKWIKNNLSGLSKWKLFDNIRRSVIPITLITLLVLGPFVYAHAGVWFLFAAAVIILPGLTLPLYNLFKHSETWSIAIRLRSWSKAAFKQLLQGVVSFALLPFEFLMHLHAICITLVRMITRRQLLEWQTSSEAELLARKRPSMTMVVMWSCPLLTLAYLIVMNQLSVALSPVMLISIGLWFSSPIIAWHLSTRYKPEQPRLSFSEQRFLRDVSRKTWSFFETFVNSNENWLPPDNFQEDPQPLIASRTSPTNIGGALLCNLAAYDLGFLSQSKMLRRVESSLNTLEKMERFRGHFYNWYDTRTLKPLYPQYISTVDSGNFHGFLSTLESGLQSLPHDPLIGKQVWEELADLLRDVVKDKPGNETLNELHETFTLSALNGSTTNLADVLALCEKLLPQLSHLKSEHQEDSSIKAALNLLVSILEEIYFFMPWISESQKDCARVTLSHIPTLKELADETFFQNIDLKQWTPDLQISLRLASEKARQRIHHIGVIARKCRVLTDINYRFLFDPSRKLFSIGFNVNLNRLDTSYYDLLASEARLASYIAISTQQVRMEHWFSLSRLITSYRGDPTLISWSGSMFEYLMPLLIMPSYSNTILDQTYRSAVQEHIAYGHQKGVPWGFSESAFNSRDLSLNYQYRAFGVPTLGLKRGLSDDLVVAPYATALALLVMPREACKNLLRMTRDNFQGKYGFYEAVDYTPSRLPKGKSKMIVRSFMAHHQAMSLLALAATLTQNRMQKRFLSHLPFKANDVLLQERTPKETKPIHPYQLEKVESRREVETLENARVYTNPHLSAPQIHLLSNGRYHLMLTHAGGGYCRWNDIAVTRWREDPAVDNYGTFAFLRDRKTGKFWSTSYQPSLVSSSRYKAFFSSARAEFQTQYHDVSAITEIAVSPQDDIDVRKITLINRSRLKRSLDITTYAEMVMTAAAQDISHPSFSNLFVQTEILKKEQAILCKRRPRSETDSALWTFHMLFVVGMESSEQVSFETDRSLFIGRGRTIASPQSMFQSLKNSQGSVLDPIVSIRQDFELEADETVIAYMVSGVAESREKTQSLIAKYRDHQIAERVFELSWTHQQVMLRHLNITEADSQLYEELASPLLYHNSQFRASPDIITNNQKGQNSLWGYGISGDLPILLLKVRSSSSLSLVRQLIAAHSFWRTQGLNVDLVILTNEESVYRQSLADQILGITQSGPEAQMLNKSGGLFILKRDKLTEDDRNLFHAVARVVLDDQRGDLKEQLKKYSHRPVYRSVPGSTGFRRNKTPFIIPSSEKLFPNGMGGFSKDGKEYVIDLNNEQNTPAPWVNVISNPEFGTVISERGCSYTWNENSHEFRLTPWYNDPVTDRSGEAWYIKDKETGIFWSPSPFPARGLGSYRCRHGFGYSIFEHQEEDIFSQLSIYVAINNPIKLAHFRIRNMSGEARHLSITGFWEWVLGESRHRSAMQVVTERDLQTGALLVRNRFNMDFPERVVFVDVTRSNRTFTGDRQEFLGRNGTLESPQGMRSSQFSGKLGAGLDPCIALQTEFKLDIDEEKEVLFILGVGKNLQDAQRLINSYRDNEEGSRALEEVQAFWSTTLSAVKVETPDPALNILMNGWLLYQTLACRFWARTGYYQSGGAYGFRDQLQDVMGLVYSRPDLTREHILKAAAHQFREGDVQHWWHPPSSKGVRTRFSDDYLWLPYVTLHYLKTTRDTAILKEEISYLHGRALKPEEEADFDIPQISPEKSTLYDHCIRSIRNGLKFGEHGLPLIGCGDWNDGMNRVGIHGRGESVWLAFFLYDILTQFSKLANEQNDSHFGGLCQSEAMKLQKNIEAFAWDGEWYRRAYFDDGQPLGSSKNQECQIDSLPQSWAVLSEAADADRARESLAAVEHYLINRDEKVIQLFVPPFDTSNLNPGYIKAYVPGIRENGAQYTHAAIWTVMAFAKAGEFKKAWELFSMINPILHSNTPSKASIYKVEPYVMSADIYTVKPHQGRGGWTWYTGSAAWMYRLVLESLLGFNMEGNHIQFKPCPHPDWNSYKIEFRYHETTYRFNIHLSQKNHRIESPYIKLINDLQVHEIPIHL